MEQHVFVFSSTIEGTTEKVLQFIKPLMSIYNWNFGFIEQKMYFWTLQRVPSTKNSINWHYFCNEKNYCWPFQSCPLNAYVSTTPRCTVPLKYIFYFSLSLFSLSLSLSLSLYLSLTSKEGARTLFTGQRERETNAPLKEERESCMHTEAESAGVLKVFFVQSVCIIIL